MDTQRFQLVLDHITAHPDTWDQTHWHCSTKHCFAGWAQILSGQPINTKTVRMDARRYLGLSRSGADYCFSGSCTLTMLRAFLNAPDEYNQAEYNQDGYDQDGYNREGYNQAGYDRAGYNQAGYDQDGLDKDMLSVPAMSCCTSPVVSQFHFANSQISSNDHT